MRNIVLLLLPAVLVGCVAAKPMFIAGRNYMGGDSSCVRYTQKNDESIQCYNASGKFTGDRYPLTDNQLKAYQDRQEDSSQQQSVHQNNPFCINNDAMRCSN